MTPLVINIHTDGSCLGNPGNGGCAYIMQIDDLIHRYSCGHFNTTNNRMELMAVLSVFIELKALEIDSKLKYQINLYSDSKYVTDAINKNWLFNWVRKGFVNVKNSDLWSQLYTLISPLMLMDNIDVNFIWIKGHNGNTINEAVDIMAKQACNNQGIVTNCIYSNRQINEAKTRGTNYRLTKDLSRIS